MNPFSKFLVRYTVLFSSKPSLWLAIILFIVCFVVIFLSSLESTFLESCDLTNREYLPLHLQSCCSDWRWERLNGHWLNEWEKKAAQALCLHHGLIRCLEIILDDIVCNSSSEVGLGFKYLNRLFQPESSWGYGVPLYLAVGKCAYLILKKLNVDYSTPSLLSSISFSNSHFSNVSMKTLNISEKHILLLDMLGEILWRIPQDLMMISAFWMNIGQLCN